MDTDRANTLTEVRSDEMVFGGLASHVDVMGAAGPNAFYLQRITAAESAKEEYGELMADLTRRLGSPHSLVVDAGYPWAPWAWHDVGVSLRIAEHFTEYVSLMVARGLFRV